MVLLNNKEDIFKDKEKHTKVLGVWTGHNSTACLMIDGEIVSCVSEERFKRIKNYAGFPEKSIEFCLEYGKIKPKELDIVVLCSTKLSLSKPFKVGSKKFTLRGMIRKIPPLDDFLYKIFSNYFFRKYNERRVQTLSNFLGIDKNKVIIADHHLLHAYAPYFGSGFKKALIFTLDGGGDDLTGSVSIGHSKKIERIKVVPLEKSLGLLWDRVTRYLGMKSLEDEWKVMGLAAYGRTDVAYKVFKEIIWLENGEFKTSIRGRQFEEYLKEKLYKIRFDTIAYGLQKYTEELVLEWVNYWTNKTGIKEIVLGGGVFMNVKVNMLLCDIYKKVFVFPSGGDESLAIGGCYYGSVIKKVKKIHPLKEIYFGPEFSNSEIKTVLDKYKEIKFTRYGDIESMAAKLLAKGEIIAIMNGRMEWGARALGNRSILADARNLENIKEINEAIKKRDFWMPFAPAILEERFREYVNNPKNSPYMILAFRATEKGKKHLVAATHQYDGTLRPQTVNNKSNQRFYKILKKFEKLTGVGGLVNTSFNLHGYPIVMTPEDALHVFENSGLNYLVIGNFLIEKRRIKKN